MKLKDIKKVLVIGAGTMGHQIGFLCAMNGYKVSVFDISREMLDKAKDRVALFAKKMVHLKRLEEGKMIDTLNLMEYTTDKKAAAAEADIVTESVPEDIELKKKIFSEFNGLCPERTVFTTNTSTLIPSMFAEDTGRPDRFLAFHFHDIIQTDVIDVMPHPKTDPEITLLVKEFAESMDQVVIMLKNESFGYVFNAMLSSLLSAAMDLATNNIAEVKDIDRAFMGIMKTKQGPFGIIDSVGLDTVWKITDNGAKLTGDPQKAKNAGFLKSYIDKGSLGVKSGQGFYSYPEPAFLKKDFVKG